MILLIAAGCSSTLLAIASHRFGHRRTRPSPPAAIPARVRQLLRRSPTKPEQRPTRIIAAGVVHELNGRTGEALREFNLATEKDPANEWLVLEVSRRVINARRWDDAAQILTRATASGRMSGEVYARLGMVYAQQGKSVGGRCRQSDCHQEIPGIARRLSKSLSWLRAAKAARKSPGRAGGSLAAAEAQSGISRRPIGSLSHPQRPISHQQGRHAGSGAGRCCSAPKRLRRKTRRSSSSLPTA